MRKRVKGRSKLLRMGASESDETGGYMVPEVRDRPELGERCQ